MKGHCAEPKKCFLSDLLCKTILNNKVEIKIGY